MTELSWTRDWPSYWLSSRWDAQTLTPQQPDDGNLSTPSVWRTNRHHAAAKVEALSSNGMDENEIPAFLRKQAD
jgi:cell division protein FtsZ